MAGTGAVFEARLVAARAVAPTVRELVFERVDGRPMQHLPGQFVTAVLPLRDADGDLQRDYSISSLPDGSPRFELLVTRVVDGAGSAWLHGIEPGTTLQMTGPQGRFTRLLDAAKPALLVAAGPGFAPFRAMLMDAIRAGRREPVWLLLGLRDEEDMPYRVELEALPAKHPWLRLEVTLSRGGAGWKGRKGYVQDHVPELWSELAAEHPEACAWVAGLRPMVFAVRDLLHVDLGLEPKRLRIEAWD